MAQYTSSFTGAEIDSAITKANGLPSTSVSAAQNGTTLSLVTTGEKYVWNSSGSLDYSTIDQSVTDISTTIVNQVTSLNNNALLKTSQSLSAAEKSQVITNLGINSSQIRNITISTSEPTSSDGNDGDIWLVY